MIKFDRDLLAIPGEKNSEVDLEWIPCNVADR